MCTTTATETGRDRAVIITGGEGAPGATIVLTSKFNAGGASPRMVRGALAENAADLYDVLVENLPVTTLRALTSLMVAGLAASLETRPAAALPGKGAGWALVADADEPRIDTIGIDEVLAPGDAGDIRPAGKDMETSIGVLIDEYKARASTARKAPSGTGDASYLTGVTEGLRIARRVVIRPAVAGRTP
jgi:hypothetical protein